MSIHLPYRPAEDLRVVIMSPYRYHPLLVEPVASACAAWAKYQVSRPYQSCDDESWEHFNLAASRNLCVEEAVAMDADVVIVTDADTYAQRRGIRDAIEHAYQDGVVHLPFTEYRRQPPLSGQVLYKTKHARGQVYVCRPDAWQEMGGQDVRFTHWGPEDEAFAIAHVLHFGEEMPRHAGVAVSREHSPVEIVDPAIRDYQRNLLRQWQQALERKRNAVHTG